LEEEQWKLTSTVGGKEEEVGAGKCSLPIILSAPTDDKLVDWRYKDKASPVLPFVLQLEKIELERRVNNASRHNVNPPRNSEDSLR
jgi:hypothetical protein